MSLEQYIKSGVIGKGSYGEVWKVKHKKDRKLYVLKKLDLHNASKRERKAAEQEAKLLSRLKHPNIVSYKDSFEGGDGYLYIAMGYCEGGDLYARLKEQKGQALEEKQIVEWFVQIAMALQYMHERNILHRDLKTQNIFLTKSKIIKVGDLGIAKVLDSSNDMATTLIGTPYYMSPELFSNKPYNHKSDVWALGCCVYEMATLKHAFNAKDMNSLVYKILKGKSPQMPKIYSDELMSLIKAMMNHNTDKRPSVNRILRDPFIKKNIAVFLEGTKKNRRPSSSGSRPGSSESRRPRVNSSEEDRDGSESVRSVASSVSSVSSVAGMNREYTRQKAQPVEEKLEPLHDGPDLEPIREEQTPRDLLDGGDANPSRQVNRPAPQPREPPVFQAPLVGEVAQAGIRKKKRRFLAEAAQQNQQVQQKPAIINIESRKSPVPTDRPLRPNNESAFVKRQSDALSVNSKPPRAESPNNNHVRDSPVRQRNLSPKARSDGSPVGRSSGARSPSDRAGSRSPRNKSSAVHRSQSPKSSSGGSSSGSVGASGSKKSAIGNPRPVTKPRPLPAKARSADPPAESAEPQKSKSSRVSARDRESGYGSSSSAANSRNEDVPEETPRGSINKSARERRREQKERETPRTARSVDITPRISQSEPSRRPGTADNNRRPESWQPKSEPMVEEIDGRIKKASSAPTFQERKSPSPVPEKAVVSKPRHVRQPSLGGEEESSSSNEGEDNESEEVVKKKETKRNDKDMKNFISLLDTTLRMNKDDDKSDSDDDDIVTPDKLAPPGSTTYFKRSKKKKAVKMGAGGDGPLAAMAEPEEDKTGTEDKGPLSPKLNVQEYLELYPGGSPQAAAGKTLTTTGRLWERITMLRKDCIRGLGVEKLKGAYDILDQFEADNLETQLVLLMGKEEFDEYAGKIWQLKFCEEAAFGLI